MPNRTVYVSESDDQVWEDAQALAEGREGSESFSKTVTSLLRSYVVRLAQPAGGDPVDSQYEEAVKRFAKDIRLLGVEAAGSAFARAAADVQSTRTGAGYKAGKKRSRRKKTKAHAEKLTATALKAWESRRRNAAAARPVTPDLDEHGNAIERDQ